VKKTPHTPLSRERILAAALHLVDAQGLRRLTMRRLGDALEVEAMAIYHHFPLGKEALLDGLVEHLSAVPVTAAPEVDWDERLRAWARAYRSRVAAHPGMLPLLASRPVRTPATLAAAEALYAACHDAGLRGPAILDAVRTLRGYAIGFVTLEIQDAQTADDEPVTDGRYPHAAALRSYAAAREPDAQFETGLTAVLAGIASLAAARA
jgi:AcrR family transcriptional regulator